MSPTRRPVSRRRRVDLRVSGGGTIYLVDAATPRGQRWLDRRIAAGALYCGGAVAVEHRYIAALVAGAQAERLRVA